MGVTPGFSLHRNKKKFGSAVGRLNRLKQDDGEEEEKKVRDVWREGKLRLYDEPLIVKQLPPSEYAPFNDLNIQ